MKREVVFILILVFSIFSVSLIYADEQQQIENAYACVANQISRTGCSALSFDEKVFSVLINKTCTNALISSASSGWSAQ